MYSLNSKRWQQECNMYQMEIERLAIMHPETLQKKKDMMFYYHFLQTTQ